FHVTGVQTCALPIFSVMAIPVLIHRLPDQRWIGAGSAALILAGYCGIYLATEQALWWMIVMGLGAGGSLVLAMTMFGLRSTSARSEEHTSELQSREN